MTKIFKYYIIYGTFERPFFSKDKDLKKTIKGLPKRQNYRLPAKDQSNPWTVPRLVLKTLGEAFKKPNKKWHWEENIKTAILDGAEKSEKDRRDYLYFFGLGEGMNFIARESIIKNAKWSETIPQVLLIAFLAPIYLILSGLKKRKSGYYASNLKEFVEMSILSKIIRKKEVNKIYQFSIGERDANMITLLLRNLRVYNTKISSNTPLSFYNRDLIADTLILNNYYQFEELKHNKNQIKKGVHVFGPEKLPKYWWKYRHEKIPKRKTLGFYSNGAWIRKKSGHIDPGIGTFPSEEKLLEILKSFRKKNSEIELKIFPHPKEKETEILYKKTKEYYKNLFGYNIKIAEMNENTTEQFDDIEVAIGAFSNSLMERLYMGYKTVFYVEHFSLFPINNTDLNKICAISKNDKLLKSEWLFSDEINPLGKMKELEKYTYLGSDINLY